MSRFSPRSGAAAAALLLLTAGCGGPETTVNGEVTYDGQPVRRGYVTFTPADGQGPTAGGMSLGD